MKIRSIIIVLLSGTLFFFANVVHAQSMDADALSVLEATDPLSADSVPTAGTFYSATMANQGTSLGPPFPGNPNNLPAWDLGGGKYLLDDLDSDGFSGYGMRAMDDSSPPGFDDGGSGDGGNFYPMFSLPDYGTNLWLAITNLAGNTTALLVSNTLADVQYEIQSKAGLPQTNWNSEGFFLGSEITNWTPASATATNYPNLFYRIRSWADSTGSGIPDWWWLKFFGQDTNVDAFADPDGDGLDNLQEFENGTDPTVYNTPPTPPDTNAPTPVFNIVSGSQGYFDVIGSGLPSDLSTIRIFRHSDQFYMNGMIYWAIAGNYYGGTSEYPTDLPDGSFDIPAASITNGIAQIPASEAYAFGDYQFQAEAVHSNGVTSASVWLGNDFHNAFVDGRSQLKDNLRFLLRAASADIPFEINGTLQQTDYVSAGFFDSFLNFDPLRPFEDNYLYRNFDFDEDNMVTNHGVITDGTDDGYYAVAGMPKGVWYGSGWFGDYFSDGIDTGNLTYQVDFAHFITTNGVVAPSSWNVSQSRWLFPPSDTDFLGGFPGDQNLFGLPYLSELSLYTNDAVFLFQIFYPDAPGPGVCDFETAQPDFQTAGYYFARVNIDPMPEQNDADFYYWEYQPPTTFSTTNTTPLIVLGVGQQSIYSDYWGGNVPVQIAGYAKLSVQNGYSGVYGYLAQYFDKAYQIDTNGVTTTNSAGILSPYGNFFPMMPGRAALVTMPDIDTGERGTCMVYCASMQLDKNADGNMDFSFNGADFTSQASPDKVWVNNGHIVPGTGGNLDKDVEVLGKVLPNYSAGKITCQRDLENFFRLWICGLPSLPASQGYTVTLSCHAISGSPAINLYLAETNGGTLYLTDTNTAQSLVNEMELGMVSSGSTYTFPDDFFDGTNKYLLFEGADIGEGQFTLTVYQNGNEIAYTSVFIDLHGVEDLYEQARIIDVPTTFPAMVNTTNTSTFVSDHELPPSLSEDKQLVVFVHGWRMTPWDTEDFSDTMFKRLYWAGYQGVFASLRWPTLSRGTDGLLGQWLTYNRSEHIAFDSGAGTCAYLDWLQGRFPDYSINVAAHSMGNIVMMEALKDQLAEGHHVIDNYVMMQAAVPAHCYDTSLANYSRFTAAEVDSPTPDIYRGYPGAIGGAVGNQIVNFFNTNDFALATGFIHVPLLGNVDVSWEANEVTFKPDFYQNYSSDGTNCFNNYSGLRIVTNPHEEMAFVVRPRAKAAGALEGIAGQVNGGELDLNASYGFNRAADDHSAQFNWTLQQLGGTTGFYKTLLQKLFP